MRYQVTSEGQLADGEVFFDVTNDQADGLPDGLKVDRAGTIYATGPGGVWIFSPEGKHIGKIEPPETPANLHWGDADGKTLYITARTSVYRTRVETGGIVL